MNEQLKWNAARSIMLELINHGYEAVIVGGAVRDKIIGREPGDVDVATEAEPHVVKQIFKKTADVGIEHGTIMVLHHEHPVEVTTYRTESTYTDHRRPDEVHFVKSLKEDLQRRDFTMNALAVNAEGEVIDYFSGKSDIEKRIIRSVGNPEERFSEDALRMLRAVRFASQLGFEIESDTFKAIQKLSSTIELIAVERIKAEIDKIFLSDHPEIGMELLTESNLGVHLPVLDSEEYVSKLSLWENYKSLGKPANGWAFINLLTGFNKYDALARGYKLSNSEKKTMKLINDAVLFRKNAEWTPLEYYSFPKDILIVAELYTSILDPLITPLTSDKIQEGVSKLPIRNRSELVVNGHDLIQWSGQKGGPWVKSWLNWIEKSIVLGEVNNDREVIREWFQREFNNNK